MKNKLLKSTSIAALTLLVSATSVFAHVVVKPDSVGVAKFQTFTMGVPVEKDMPTVGMRLVIPSGLQSVTPNVKPGWKIDMKKTGDGESATVTEISWTGGSIPSGQRDDFPFSAQVPSKPTDLSWKAYQTYSDGSVVNWDLAAGTAEVEGKSGPYSVTKVVDDLNSSPTTANASKTTDYVAWGGLILGALALVATSRHSMMKK